MAKKTELDYILENIEKQSYSTPEHFAKDIQRLREIINQEKRWPIAIAAGMDLYALSNHREIFRYKRNQQKETEWLLIKRLPQGVLFSKTAEVESE